jgi:hypothetical protein
MRFNSQQKTIQSQIVSGRDFSSVSIELVVMGLAEAKKEKREPRRALSRVVSASAAA